MDTDIHVVDTGESTSTATTGASLHQRTKDYLGDVFATPKSRRLDIARQIKCLETKYMRTVNRIKKSRHQLRELVERLDVDVREREMLDAQIRSLKREVAD